MANSKFNARHGLSVGTPPVDVVDSTGLLAASAIPNLDASKITSGVIDSARLPSYVDDVLEYADLAALPATGETGKIYVALDSNKTYRWSGSTYVEISAGSTVPGGGATGQVLGKASGTDQDFSWLDKVSGTITVSVVSVLPGSPDANTLYIVTS